MAVTVACPHCGLELNAPEELIGRQARCSGCRNVFVVSAPAAEPPAEPVQGGGPSATSGAPGAGAAQAGVESRRPAAEEPAYLGAGVEAESPRLDENPYAPPAAPAAAPGRVEGRVSGSAAIRRGFELVHAKIGPFLILGLVYFGITIVLQAAGFIPYLGLIVGFASGIFIYPWLHAGLSYAALKAHDENREPNAGDLFSQGEIYGSLVLLALVQTGIQIAAVIVAAIPAFVIAVALGVAMEGRGDPPEALVLILLLVVIPLLALASVACQAAFAYAIPRLVDARRGFGDALSVSLRLAGGNIWGTVGLVLFSWVLMLAGLLLCAVGTIYFIPVTMAMWVCAYRTAVPGPEREAIEA